MEKNIVLAAFFLILFAGCLTYVNENDIVKKKTFAQTLVINGVYIDKHGQFQELNFSNQFTIFYMVNTGLKNSVLNSHVFKSVMSREQVEKNKTQTANTLALTAYSDLLTAEKKDILVKVVIRIGIIIAKTDKTNAVIFRRKYQISAHNQDFMATESYLINKVLRVLFVRIMNDLAMGDFDNPEYISDQTNLIEVPMPYDLRIEPARPNQSLTGCL